MFTLLCGIERLLDLTDNMSHCDFCLLWYFALMMNLYYLKQLLHYTNKTQEGGLSTDGTNKRNDTPSLGI